MKRLIYTALSLIIILSMSLFVESGRYFCGTKIYADPDICADELHAAYSYEAVYEGAATYAQAITRESYIYTTYDLSTSLFAVPYTYLVRIIQETDNVYYVRYAEDEGDYKAVYGYCKKQDFDPIYTQPQVTYLHKTVQVTYAPKDTNVALPSLTSITVDAAYYGVYYSGGKAYSYVLLGTTFGYILGANDDYELLSLSTSTTSGTTGTVETVGSNGTSGTSGSDGTAGTAGTSGTTDTQQTSSQLPQIITSITLTALAIVAIMLIFFTHKKSRR